MAANPVNREHILIVENDPDYCRLMQATLSSAGFEVTMADNPARARPLLERSPIDLAVINIRLLNDADAKDVSGLELAKSCAQDLPKIMMTAYASVDYVREALSPQLNGIPPAKGFFAKQEGFDALITLIRKTLSLRKDDQVQTSPIRHSNHQLGAEWFYLDFNSRSLWLNQAEIRVSPQEFSLLQCLLEQPNQVVSRETISEEAFHDKQAYDHFYDSGKLDTLLLRLRKKIEVDPQYPQILVTVRGHGIKIVL